MFDFLFSGWFWGFILLIFATGLIIKSVFKIRLSLFFIFLLVCLIFFTVNLITGNNSESVTYFASEKIVKLDDISELNIYNAIFCKITYDLTQLEATGPDTKIEIKNLFGKTRILINKSQKVKVQSRSFFGSGITPDDTKTILGNHIYFTSRYSKNNPHLLIDTQNIFGSTEIYEK
ncbi:MAG: LiaF domain-containing protein [Bacteroidia bacterium]